MAPSTTCGSLFFKSRCTRAFFFLGVMRFLSFVLFLLPTLDAAAAAPFCCSFAFAMGCEMMMLMRLDVQCALLGKQQSVNTTKACVLMDG